VSKLGYNEFVKKCGRCGGKLRRIHRTFFERLSYMAKYRCKECHSLETLPRPYRFHFGGRCRCHRCGTYRISRLKGRDRIDPMESGLLNLCERLAGGKLYHCKFCRIQFWDRREWIPMASAAQTVEAAPKAARESTSTTQPSTAAPPSVSSVQPIPTPGHSVL
jgi:hypothetical protein